MNGTKFFCLFLSSGSDFIKTLNHDLWKIEVWKKQKAEYVGFGSLSRQYLRSDWDKPSANCPVFHFKFRGFLDLERAQSQLNVLTVVENLKRWSHNELDMYGQLTFSECTFSTLSLSRYGSRRELSFFVIVSLAGEEDGAPARINRTTWDPPSPSHAND